MLGEELPDDLVRGDARMSVEIRVEGDLSRDVHRALIPLIETADQAVELYVGAALAPGSALGDDGSWVSRDSAIRSHDPRALAQRSRIDA